MKVIKWTINDIIDIIKKRQENEFDSNIAVSGDRGNGKSTLINKLLYRIKCFRPWKHQVYNREEVISLLKSQQYGICWDDEAINSAYKRDFQNKGQQELIKIIIAYRDNFNLLASAIPSFFSLDLDLRELYFLHLHVIERGIAVVHMPTQGKLYGKDRWDSKHNARIEEGWAKKQQENPHFKPPYQKLTTFRGYLFFKDLTEKQRALYKEIKKHKREISFITKEEEQKEKEKKEVVKEVTFYDKLYTLLIDDKLTEEGIRQGCLIEGKKYTNAIVWLRKKLKDEGENVTLMSLLEKGKKILHSSVQDERDSILDGL